MLALSGCDYVLGLQARSDAALEDVPLEAMPDAMAPDAPFATCRSDSFTSLAGWNPPNNTNPGITFAAGGGALQVAFDSSGNDSAEKLRSAYVIDFAGARVSAGLRVRPATGTSSSLALETVGGATAYRIDVTSNAFAFVAGSQMQVNIMAPTPRYVRMRHDPVDDAVVFELAGDQMMFVEVVRLPVVAFEPFRIVFVGQMLPPITASVAEWDNLRYECTP